MIRNRYEDILSRINKFEEISNRLNETLKTYRAISDKMKNINYSIPQNHIVIQNKINFLNLKEKFDNYGLYKCNVSREIIEKFSNNKTYNILSNELYKKQKESLMIQNYHLSSRFLKIEDKCQQYLTIMLTIINNSGLKIIENAIREFEEAKKDPNSVINWEFYKNRLYKFFWVMPYGITTNEIHKILRCVNNEKEFDEYMERYFTEEKISLMCKDIEKMIPDNEQILEFNQIVDAYSRESYILASASMCNMIDNALSYYLINKGRTPNAGIFEPIIKDLEGKYGESPVIIIMLSNNVNRLYEKVDFNKEILIDTNKKVRRNLTAHGKYRSNEKIDVIMLFNMFYYILIIQEELKEYKDALCQNKRGFYIPSEDKKREIEEKIRKSS